MKIALDVNIHQGYSLSERFELELLGDAKENRSGYSVDAEYYHLREESPSQGFIHLFSW